MDKDASGALDEAEILAAGGGLADSAPPPAHGSPGSQEEEPAGAEGQAAAPPMEVALLHEMDRNEDGQLSFGEYAAFGIGDKGVGPNSTAAGATARPKPLHVRSSGRTTCDCPEEDQEALPATATRGHVPAAAQPHAASSSAAATRTEQKIMRDLGKANAPQ